MAFCTNCGTKIENGSQFCVNCGTKINFNSEPLQQNMDIAPAANAQQTNTQPNYVPPQANYAAPVMAMLNVPVQKSSMDATGLVLGIISVLIGLLWHLGAEGGENNELVFLLIFPVFLLGLAGFILSAISFSRNKKAGQPTSMGIAALIVNIIGIVLFINLFKILFLS
jgi:cation transport ATPase